MPRRKSDRPLKKISIRVFEDDWDWLDAAFPSAGRDKMMRNLLTKFRRRVEDRAARYGNQEEVHYSNLEDISVE